MNATNAIEKTERMSRLGLFNEPAGYVDGANQYEFVQSNPAVLTDPQGLYVIDLRPPGFSVPYPRNYKVDDASNWIASLMPESLYNYYINLKKPRGAHPSPQDNIELGGTFLNEVIGLPEIQSDMAQVRGLVRQDALIHAGEARCEELTILDGGSYPITAPMSEPQMRLSLQRFTIYWEATCKVGPAGKGQADGSDAVPYSCTINWTLNDTFDFMPLEPWGWMGTPFNIFGFWTDYINGIAKPG